MEYYLYFEIYMLFLPILRLIKILCTEEIYIIDEKKLENFSNKFGRVANVIFRALRIILAKLMRGKNR